MDEINPEELRRLNEETKSIWDQNATWWDARMGEGGVFQTRLIGPTTQRLLGLREGETVLDVACGNGAFSRRMAALGAHVVATDVSEVFLARARERTTEYADRIEYRFVDATEESELLALGERRFDAAVSTMALMDMATITPLLTALARLLKPQGRFVFSVLHPCFSSDGLRKVIEEEDKNGEIVTTYSIRVTGYIRQTVEKGLGVIGQPVPQYYFHRPLSELLRGGFQAGFCMDALEEPTFDEKVEGKTPFSWENFKEIPPVLVARLRLAAS